MSSPVRAEALRSILDSYGDAWTFTESQEAPVGDVLADADVDRALRTVIAQMRERHDFASPLDDAALAAVVRGFYAGSDDEALASRLAVAPAAVRAGRFDLHLFRPGEAPASDHERAAMREASRVGHRWNAEFESVLSAAGYPVSFSWNPLEDVLASTDEGENVASAN